MGDNTAIEWTGSTWTPIRARVWEIQNNGSGKERIGWPCEHVSPGCVNCYAEAINRRLGTGHDFKPANRFREDRVGTINGEVKLFLDDKMLLQPLRWKKPRKIFVCSMTDLFADFVRDEWIDKVFAVMALCPQHTFQVLTKRPERMRDYCSTIQKDGRWLAMEDVALRLGYEPRGLHDNGFNWISHKQFLPNVWLGVSVEDAQRKSRIDILRDVPAAKRFLSLEPLLGDLGNVDLRGIDWVIVGGESGPDARPMHPDWARALRDQCQAAGVPFFFKQWGEWIPAAEGDDGTRQYWEADDGGPDGRFEKVCAKVVYPFGDIQGVARIGKKAAGARLDGVEHREFPA